MHSPLLAHGALHRRKVGVVLRVAWVITGCGGQGRNAFKFVQAHLAFLVGQLPHLGLLSIVAPPVPHHTGLEINRFLALHIPHFVAVAVQPGGTVNLALCRFFFGLELGPPLILRLHR